MGWKWLTLQLPLPREEGGTSLLVWLCKERQAGKKQGIRKSPWKGNPLWQINTNEAL